MRTKSTWTGIFILLIMGAAYTWATWQYFTLRVPGGNDFLTHYAAWEAYLVHGLNPYSDEAALYTQQAIYGRPALPGEDQNRLAYPFYSILVHAPFLILDYPLARAAYMTLLQGALVIGLWICLDWLRWRPPAWMLAILLAWTLLFYPQARGIILGQFAIFGFLSLAGTLYFLNRGQDTAAGALLVLSTVKPTLVFLVVPFLLLWAAARRRWWFIGGFVGLLVLMVLGSTLILPTWIGDFLHRVNTYSGYTVGQSPVWLLTQEWLPGMGRPGEVALTGLLLLALVAFWVSAIRPSGEDHFGWVLGLTLLVSSLIVPRSATTNYVMLLVPLLWVFAALDRSFSWGRAAVLASMLISFVGLWWLHSATVVGNQEQAIMFIPLPLVLGVVWMAGRRWLEKDAAVMGLHC